MRVGILRISVTPLRQEIILISKLKICTKSFNINKENRYKMKQSTKTKVLYYNIVVEPYLTSQIY
jgi:hypothetical protein